MEILIKILAYSIGTILGSLFGCWLALDLPEIIQEHKRKKEDINSTAARERERILQERLKERYKNDIYF